MVSAPLTVRLSFESGDKDEHAENELQYLLDELRATGRLEITPAPAGAPPPGARGEVVAQAAAVIVALNDSGLSLQYLLDLVQDWLRRRRSGTLRLKIGDDELVLTGATERMQQQALDAFIERHRR